MNRRQLIVAWAVVLFFICLNIASAQPELEVTGIIYDKKGNSAALVNGGIVYVGCDINGAEVMQINEDSVEFKYNNEVITLKIGKKLSTASNSKSSVAMPNSTSYSSSYTKLFTAPISAEKEVVEASQIKAVYFHISKSLGAVDAYVIFRDENGTSCATSGNLDIIKKISYEEKESVAIGYKLAERTVLKAKKGLLKNIYFKPADFQFMKLRSGDEIYGLQIDLDPSEINEGDIIILEWYGFKKEEKVYGF